MKLLFNYPTRRHHLCLRSLDRYIEKLKRPDSVRFHLSCDEDDVNMNNDHMRSRLAQYKNVSISYRPNPERSANRPVNVIPDMDWNIISVMADDTVPLVYGFDEIIIEDMKRLYPDTDGALWYSDGHQHDAFNTHPIIGKLYYQRFGYVVNPVYKMLYADTEFTCVAKLLNKITYSAQCIIEHQHPTWGFGGMDDIYKMKDTYYGPDGMIFTEHSKINFGVRQRVEWKGIKSFPFLFMKGREVNNR